MLFNIIHPQGNTILDILRYYSLEDESYYYTVLVTHALDKEYSQTFTVTTDINAPSIDDAIRIGLKGLQHMYKNICSVVTVYDGSTGQRIKKCNLNNMPSLNQEPEREEMDIPIPVIITPSTKSIH